MKVYDLRLENIDDGELNERFQSALKRVIENILNFQTPAKQKRELIIKMTFTPNPEDRGEIELENKVEVKLAGKKPIYSTVSASIDRTLGTVDIVQEILPKIAPMFPEVEVEGLEN